MKAMADREHPFHSMSSYLGSFPPKVPRAILNAMIPRGSVVLDPFCGSGTTLVEARRLGHESVGIDLNPLAVSLSQAKMESVELGDLEFRLGELAQGFRGDGEIEDTPFNLEPIFHRRTLAQLAYLRRALSRCLPEDRFLIGCLLGILHGKSRANGSTAYLSVDMPNTFSMSPAYVRRFVESRRLPQPPVDVFSKLRERARWLLRDGPLPASPGGIVIHGDGARLQPLLSSSGIGRVDAILTSPPYLGVLRYGAFNWIRLWFLGHEQQNIDRALDSTDSLDAYLSFMVTFLLAAGDVLPSMGILVLVIGDVFERNQNLNLAERVWEEVGDLVPFDLVELAKDEYDTTKKTTRVWGKERRGRATPLDRHLVLRKISNSARRKHPRETLRALSSEQESQSQRRSSVLI